MFVKEGVTPPREFSVARCPSAVPRRPATVYVSAASAVAVFSRRNAAREAVERPEYYRFVEHSTALSGYIDAVVYYCSPLQEPRFFISRLGKYCSLVAVTMINASCVSGSPRLARLARLVAENIESKCQPHNARFLSPASCK